MRPIDAYSLAERARLYDLARRIVEYVESPGWDQHLRLKAGGDAAEDYGRVLMAELTFPMPGEEEPLEAVAVRHAESLLLSVAASVRPAWLLLWPGNRMKHSWGPAPCSSGGFRLCFTWKDTGEPEVRNVFGEPEALYVKVG